MLTLVARGAGDHAIASELHLSPHTVSSYVVSLRAKLGAASRPEMVAKSYVLGLLLAEVWPPVAGVLRCVAGTGV